MRITIKGEVKMEKGGDSGRRRGRSLEGGERKEEERVVLVF